MESAASANAEIIEAWDGVLFDRWLKYRDVLVGGVGVFGDAALEACPPPPGARVLDIGCGLGDTSFTMGEMVGPEGSVLGVDVSPRMIEQAKLDAAEVSVSNVEFGVADVQADPFDRRFDYAFSRFGVMFFTNPVAALSNVLGVMEPGSPLVLVVWRRKLDNEWLHRAELVVKPLVEEDPESDEPTCGPGPFSMANADTVSDQLKFAGFEDVALRRADLPILMGKDMNAAIELSMALGPAAEAIRLAGDQADEVRPQGRASRRLRRLRPRRRRRDRPRVELDHHRAGARVGARG